MTQNFRAHIAAQIEEVKNEGLYKDERVITSPQQADITANGKEVINFCANNYLGLANHPKIIEAAHKSLDTHGYGMASVRFICGTNDEHKELERRLADFLKMEEVILYPSAFDANGGLFETLLDAQDAIISDQLNHASIIDGVRLCKAQRYRYVNNDMADLESKLKEADANNARYKLIATDGVFSMDGIIANLKGICDLAEKHNAMVMVDDCHATGFVGKKGRGSHEYNDVIGRVDIITGTLGKALGGASGGFTAASKEIVTWLRQRSRPYLFSNAISPVVAGASLAALDLLQDDGLREKLNANAKHFRTEMQKLGFNLVPGEHAIIPVMLGDAKLAKNMADELMNEGIYVIGFSYPVVPKGQARIRTQMSAGHDTHHVDKAIAAFAKIGKKLNIIN